MHVAILTFNDNDSYNFVVTNRMLCNRVECLFSMPTHHGACMLSTFDKAPERVCAQYAAVHPLYCYFMQHKQHFQQEYEENQKYEENQ